MFAESLLGQVRLGAVRFSFGLFEHAVQEEVGLAEYTCTQVSGMTGDQAARAIITTRSRFDR